MIIMGGKSSKRTYTQPQSEVTISNAIKSTQTQPDVISNAIKSVQSRSEDVDSNATPGTKNAFEGFMAKQKDRRIKHEKELKSVSTPFVDLAYELKEKFDDSMVKSTYLLDCKEKTDLECRGIISEELHKLDSEYQLLLDKINDLSELRRRTILLNALEKYDPKSIMKRNAQSSPIGKIIGETRGLRSTIEIVSNELKSPSITGGNRSIPSSIFLRIIIVIIILLIILLCFYLFLPKLFARVTSPINIVIALKR